MYASVFLYDLYYHVSIDTYDIIIWERLIISAMKNSLNRNIFIIGTAYARMLSISEAYSGNLSCTDDPMFST